MNILPRYPHLFLYWWLVETPKYLVTLVKRLIILINNRISFTLNLKLLFTPLFGDYTIIGRFIGFVVRIFEVVIGLFIVGTLTGVGIILPFIWWLIPFYVFSEIQLWLIPIALLVFFIWTLVTRNIPLKKTEKCDHTDCEKCFRPKTRSLLHNIKSNRSKGAEDLTREKLIIELLNRSELNKQEFISKLCAVPSMDISKIELVAFDFAKENDSRYVEPEHLFLAFIKSIDNIDTILATYDSKYSLVKSAAFWRVSEREYKDMMYIWQPDYITVFTGGFGRGMTGRVTPLLDSVSEDFTKAAVRGGYKRYTVREQSIRKTEELLSGSNENLLVIGDPGSGKTSLVKGIAYKIMEGDQYKSLSNKRIVSMELGGIVGGTKSIGDVAERLKGALKEAKSSGNIILFIDEIHTLIAGTSGEKTPEISALYSILEPELSSNTIQFIGATTSQNYRKYIEPNGAFSRLFNIMEIPEATKEETIEILKYDVRKYETRYGITITYPALEKAIDLSQKLIHERVLPDKAIQIVGRAVTRITKTTKYLDSRTVALEIADVTHIPTEMVTEDEAKKLLTIETEMKKMVIGQDTALKQIGSAIKRARAGMRNEKKPIASFLFVGTTGVGKTQTAKALSKVYFGDSKNMVRLDMSEYQQLDSISRLLGSPDGSSKGILTEAVRTRPFCLVLLDELEKAHPNILLTFLQVLDDGRLTDSSGTTIDFTNTIIISTSNVGTRSIQELFTQNISSEKMNDVALQEVRSHYAPEFLNRFTGIIVFNPLSAENVLDITQLLLNDVTTNAKVKGINVTFKPELVQELAKKGYSPEWGARPLARLIEDTVESYLAIKILSKELIHGDSVALGLEVFAQDTNLA